MSMDMNLIDLDDKIIYDVNGGRNLYWLLSKLAGHRICLDDDDNACQDIYSDKAEELGFKKVDAAYIPECEANSIELMEDRYPLLWKYFNRIRRDIASITRDLNRDIDPEYYDVDYSKEVISGIKGKNIFQDIGYDSYSKLPWYKVQSIDTIYKLLLDKSIENSEEWNMYSGLIRECYKYIHTGEDR